MKVKELQQQLSKLNHELEIVCYTEDEPLQANGSGFRLLGIVDARTAHGEQCRMDDNRPSIKFEHTADSSDIALLKVTADF